MDIILVLALSCIVIVVVWFISRKRNVSVGNSAQHVDYANLQSKYEERNEEHQKHVLELVKSNSTLGSQLEASKEKIDDLQEQVAEYKSLSKEQEKELKTLNKNLTSTEEQLSSRGAKIKELEQAIEDLKGSEEQLEQRLKTQFELISNKIIEESRDKVNKFNAERMFELMNPFQKEIREFKEQISTANREQSKERTELETKIKQMVEISQGMSAEAKNLSNALRGNNKAAGNWGETILENILQNSGLTHGKEGYELQEMLRDAGGSPYRNEGGRKMIPDAVVHFPDNRNVIIDSKVSITAYTDYCNAENSADKKLHLKKHIESIKSHINELNIKSYESYVDGSLDFVMMFIPNDFAAMVALQEDLKLWQNAYNKKILIISPTNLITSLKIVSDLWSREKQHQNVGLILERGRLLYDKCSNFLESFKKMGDGLNTILNLYNSTSIQLGEKSGIIRQAEMLVESGIKSKKQLALRSEEYKKKVELQEISDADMSNDLEQDTVN